MDWGSAAEAKVTQFLELLRSSGLNFEYVFTRPDAGPEIEISAAQSSVSSARMSVDLTGPDAALMIQRGGELLHAMESVAASILRLAPEEYNELLFDALSYKQQRLEATRNMAREAIASVRATTKPYVFPPMNSRERRTLHLLLAEAGHPTASSGEGPRRFVVLYPIGQTPTPERFIPRLPAGRGFVRNGRKPLRDSESMRRTQGDSRPAQYRESAAAVVRLDPNGNPLESSSSAEPAALSEEERLTSLRRAFRKR